MTQQGIELLAKTVAESSGSGASMKTVAALMDSMRVALLRRRITRFDVTCEALEDCSGIYIMLRLDDSADGECANFLDLEVPAAKPDRERIATLAERSLRRPGTEWLH